MPIDSKTYKEHAERCLELAAEALDPVLKDNLLEAAERWTRLASDLASTSDLLERRDDPPERQAG
jgi:hypothetical protein